jgi:hypothetical protein
MKRVLIVVLLVVGAAVLGLWRSHGSVRQGLSRVVGASSDNSESVTGDETRKSFDLKPGARIEVQDINGKVEIQTSDTRTAEVYVRRLADSPNSLRRRQMIIEQTADGLLVRGRTQHLGFWDHLFGHNPNEEVVIKAPRQIALALKGINGPVTTGDIDGSLEAKGINGRVELGAASQYVELGSINGNIVIGLKQLGDRGARFSGVNGGIEIRLANGLNADLTARGMNGNVRSDIPEVTVDKEGPGSRYSARIGSGGAPITISGINGNVRLTRSETPAASTTMNEKKSAPATEQAAKSAADVKSAKSTQ